MKTSMRLAWALIWLGASAAFAAPKISVLPFTGPKATEPHAQIEKLLCATYECVPAVAVSRRGKPDWARVKALKVDLVLTGVVGGPVANRTVTVDAYDRHGKRRWREVLELARNGKLTRSGVEQLSSRVDSVFAVTPPTPPPVESEEVSPAYKKPEVVESEQITDERRTEAPAGDEESTERESSGEEEPAGSVARAERPMVVVEAGVDFVNRRFDYADLMMPNLRSYETRPLFFAPRVHVEAYPLARILSGVPQGVGLELDYRFAVGLRSIDENDVAHSTTVNRFDVAARLNFWPMDGLMLAPLVGYRGATFEVGAAPDGTKLAGMPGLHYEGLTVGGAAELGIGQLVLFGRAQYVFLLGLGEMGQEPFFPQHGGRAFDVSGGVGFRILQSFQIRGEAQFSRYALTFQPAEGSTYAASGATDQYVGGALLGRFEY